MQIVSGPVDREPVHLVTSPRDMLDGQLARRRGWIDDPLAPIDDRSRATAGVNQDHGNGSYRSNNRLPIGFTKCYFGARWA